MTDYRQPGADQPPPHGTVTAVGGGMPRLVTTVRADLLAAVTAAFEAGGHRWAWQGEADAPGRWASGTGPKDLDIWYAAPSAAGDPVDVLARAYAGARIVQADDPRRLRHTSLAVETATGPAVIDVTHGDLRVGPVLLVPAARVTTDPVARRFTGTAATADLLVRPVLRGRLPGPGRLAGARAAWEVAAPEDRQDLAQRLTAQLGSRVAADLIAVAGGAEPDDSLPRRARIRLAVRSLAPSVVGATWAQRRTILPTGPAAGPLGPRVRGVVVAVVGTDGAGKSTVADGLHHRLHGYGLPTSAAYFGMARGNLPGVALARRLLTRDLPAHDLPAHDLPTRDLPAVLPTRDLPGDGQIEPVDAATVAGRLAAADRPRLRQVAAWFYAGEYLWRYLWTVAPAVARREVVIADRWVYDLRESPWPGSPAARVAEFVIPPPDVLVLPDAPAGIIHGRKPERSLAEQAEAQRRFRQVLAERPARCAEVVVDTSGGSADPLAPLVAAVVQAAHRPRRRHR